jgi:hypothetical protein
MHYEYTIVTVSKRPKKSGTKKQAQQCIRKDAKSMTKQPTLKTWLILLEKAHISAVIRLIVTA